jgi:hypothetical protein
MVRNQALYLLLPRSHGSFTLEDVVVPKAHILCGKGLGRGAIVLARLSVCRAPSGVEGWIGGETSLEDEDVGGTVYKYASR